MGIPWYFYTIYKKYNHENELTIDENSISQIGVEHLFLDYNSMIHPCAQQILHLEENKNGDSKIEDLIIQSCLDYTRYIINIIKPKYVYIMIDGVAPRAKINQQRERRYKSHFFKEFEKDSNSIKWNSNKITPGTSFMDSLIESLIVFKKEIIKTCDLSDFIISDSNVPGEGEHKMMHVINTLDKNTGKICIYGLDADLIMLSLSNKFSSNIILIRDNTFNTKLSDADRVYAYVDIKKLKEYVCQDLRQGNDFDNITNDNLIQDYIFLCFLLGNDFLEHIPSLMIKENGLNVLIKYYNLVIRKNGNKNTLINIDKLKEKKWNECINLKILTEIFYELSKVEDYFYGNVYSVYKNKNKKSYKDSFDLDDINTNCKDVYFYNKDIIKYNEYGFKNRYYLFYGIQNKENAVKQYLTGLYWVLGYYNGHLHDNWSWYYTEHASPFASDIFAYLNESTGSKKDKVKDEFVQVSKNTNKNIDNLKKYTIEILKSSKPNTTIQQLFMVLPRESLLEIIKSKDITLYNKTIRIFKTYSKDLEDYYPTKIYLELIHKEYLWQSKIFLKSFNRKTIDIFI